MRKKTLSILIVCFCFLGLKQEALAALSADQTVTATMPTVKAVQALTTSTITTTINDDGSLAGTLDPGFRIICNVVAPQNMSLTAVVTTDTGGVNAFSGNGTTNYIVLGNTTVGKEPTALAVQDAQSASPTVEDNANCVAYSISAPTGTVGKLVYTWQDGVGDKYWTAVLTNRGNLITEIDIPAGPAKTDTFSGDDEPGDYKAVITLSFI